jgi:hypothetical protein
MLTFVSIKQVFGVIIVPFFPVKMEDQGSDAEEHMGETVCICGKVRTLLLPHLESAFKIFRRFLYHEGLSQVDCYDCVIF